MRTKSRMLLFLCSRSTARLMIPVSLSIVNNSNPFDAKEGNGNGESTSWYETLPALGPMSLSVALMLRMIEEFCRLDCTATTVGVFRLNTGSKLLVSK